MLNEIIFILHTFFISSIVIVGSRYGKNFLQTLATVYLLLSNLLLLKQISILGFTVTATDSFTIGSAMALNLINYRYGYKEAQKTIVHMMIMLIITTILGQFHLWYTPDIHDTMHPVFALLFNTNTRIVMASLCSYYLSLSLDSSFFSRLQTLKFIQNKLWLANFTATASAQLIDTYVFSYLGLYGLVHNLGHIIIVSYTMKIIALICATPLLHLANKLIPQTDEPTTKP